MSWVICPKKPELQFADTMLRYAGIMGRHRCSFVAPPEPSTTPLVPFGGRSRYASVKLPLDAACHALGVLAVSKSDTLGVHGSPHVSRLEPIL